jgi:photosystem II stability/assembly factor-like uncharacterized protein
MNCLNKKIVCITSACLMLIIFYNKAQSQSGWYQLNSGTVNNLNSVSFLNEFTGYMVGDGLGIKTSNGGFNWYVIPQIAGGTSVKFVDANTGYVANGTIYKTINGGTTWGDLHTSFVNDISFADAYTGYGVGEYSSITKTTDGGLTFESQSLTYAYYNLKTVFFLNAYTGFIGGGTMLPPYQGIVFKTINGGFNWTQINIQMQNIEFRSISFPNPTTGYMVGGDVTQSTGVIFKTIDGGNTWVQQGITNRDLNCVYFINSNTGYAVGENGMVLKTLDGSILWNSETSNTTNDLKSVYFVRPDVGYTAGLHGDVQKTLNGGTEGAPYTLEGYVTYAGTTTLVPSGKVVALNYNYQTGLITKLDSTTITNGYYRFINIPGNDSTDIAAYQDDEVADFVFGYYGNTINWANSITLFPTGSMTGINFTVNKTVNPGGAGIVGGGVFASVGGAGLADARVYARIGNNYYNIGTSVPGGAYSVRDLPPGNYEMVCDRMGYRSALRDVTLGTVNLDTINFYLTNISPIGITNQSLYIPTTYKLMQNYPNPFNPTTNIRFDIPKESRVNISIYDVLGRVVETLVDQQMKPGTYQVDWRADKYSSGLYFYRLVTNDYVDVKKMILVK